jgi:hypothetical protein
VRFWKHERDPSAFDTGFGIQDEEDRKAKGENPEET